MGEILIQQSKTIKLNNVLQYTCLKKEVGIDMNIAIAQMQSYIKAKGAKQVGPLIQYVRTYTDDNDNNDYDVVLMMQCSTYINKVEQPYSMQSVIRVPNCMFCHYCGPEAKAKLAYDKINIEAYENDITLRSESYTVFLNSESDEEVSADIFVPIEKCIEPGGLCI